MLNYIKINFKNRAKITFEKEAKIRRFVPIKLHR